MSIVTIENLTHANGEKALYKNASLQVNKGEHVALIGMNGVGKTTLLNIINGTVSTDHIDLNIHPKIKIGYLDQHQEVNLELTVLQYLRESYQKLFERQQQKPGYLYVVITANVNDENYKGSTAPIKIPLKQYKLSDITKLTDFRFNC